MVLVDDDVPISMVDIFNSMEVLVGMEPIEVLFKVQNDSIEKEVVVEKVHEKVVNSYEMVEVEDHYVH